MREQGHKTDWALIAFLGAAFCHLVYRLTITHADPDLWSHLAFGRLFVASKGFPFQDVFSYTPTKDVWVAHNWLSSVIFYKFWAGGGERALQLLKYALGLGTGALALLAARKAGGNWWCAGLGLFLVGCGLSVGYSPLRGQLFSFLGYAASLLLLERIRRHEDWKASAWLIPLYALWANLHAGVFAGLWLAGFYGLTDMWKKERFWPWIALLLALGLATLATPYRLEYWKYVFEEALATPADVVEWRSLPQALAAGMHGNVWLAAGAAALALVLVAVGRVRDWTMLLVLAFTAALSVKNIRHETYFLLSCGMLLPGLLTRAIAARGGTPTLARWRRELGAPLVVALVAASLWWLGDVSRAKPLRLETPDAATQAADAHEVGYPVGAVGFIQERGLKGDLLPTLQWGSYVLWRCAPSIRLGMDGRFRNVYPEDVIQAYFDFLYARPGWRVFLERYGADFILVRREEAVAPFVAKQPGWRLLYEDKAVLLFGRDR
jgi:hypothetical protein